MKGGGGLSWRKAGAVAGTFLAFAAGTGGAFAATHHGKRTVKHAKLTAATTTTTTTQTQTTTDPCAGHSSSSTG
jgi:hypothetical protein